MHPALLLPAFGLLALAASPETLPPRLSDTGWRADGRGLEGFSPRYPLWTDGLGKARSVRLPAPVEARNPEAWTFPAGTTFWKDFALGPRRLETRVLRRSAQGIWLYGTYVWRADQKEADLAPPEGRKGLAHLAGGRSVDAPARADCVRCHENGGSPVLGFDALQLDEAQLKHLQARGLLAHLPPARPRLQGRSRAETAALGLLHGNCGSCHRPEGPLRALGLDLRHPLDGRPSQVVATTVGRPPLVPLSGATARVVPRQAQGSALLRRMERRGEPLQMPPLGTVLPDAKGLALVRAWIDGL